MKAEIRRMLLTGMSVSQIHKLTGIKRSLILRERHQGDYRTRGLGNDIR